MARMSLWRRLLSAVGNGKEPERGPTPDAAVDAPLVEARFDFDDPRIPDVSREKVALIRSLVGDLEARSAQRGLSAELAELRRLRTTHLPKLLQSYVEIPPEHRAEVFRETGRSASYMLNERLDRMTGRLRDISAMLARGHLDAFAENMRFIDVRYGSREAPFD